MRSLTSIVVSLALTVTALGCGDDDSTSAADFSACGGNPEGKWTLVALRFEDPTQLIGGALLEESACKGSVRDVATNASGSYTFNADKTLAIDIVYNIDAQVTLNNACLKALSGVEASASVCQMLADSFVDDAGYTGSTCKFSNAVCDCELRSPDAPIQSGSTWSVKGDQLTLDDRTTPFCVNAGRLQLEVTADDITGLITLRQ